MYLTPKELFETYHTDVYRTCFYMLRNPHDAEDVCQDVFVKVLQENYEAIQSLKPWILSITMNTCRNFRNKRSRILLQRNIWPLFKLKVDNQKVDEEVERKEDQENMAWYISKLSPKLREVIVLKYLHQLKNDEISSALNIPVGTVKSRANNGIEILRKKMHLDAPDQFCQVRGQS